MLDIMFIPLVRNSLNASDFIRIYQPVQAFEVHGVAKTMVARNGWGVDQGYIRAIGQAAPSPIVVFKSMEWVADIEMQDAIQQARKQGQIIILDLDDDFFHIHRTHTADSFVYNKYRNKEYLIDQLFDGVIAGTPALEKLSTKSFLIRNMINTHLYYYVPPEPTVTTIGYAGSIEHHADDIRLLKKFIGKYIERHNLKFIYLGCNEPTKLATLLDIAPARISCGSNVGITKWTTVLHKYRFDIGLLPLQLNTFNQAKSRLKGMEYAANGIPFIATPTAEYKSWNQGVVTPIEHWEWQLEQLLDYKYRLELATSAYESVLLDDINVRWTDYFYYFNTFPERTL